MLKKLKHFILLLICRTISLFIKIPVFLKWYNYLYENSSQRWVNIFHSYVKFPYKDFIWKIKLINNKWVYTKIDHKNYKTLQFAIDYKWYAPGITRLEKILFGSFDKNLLYIDIGANLGLRSLLPLSECIKTIMFEPNKELVEINKKRCIENGFTNYEIIEKGISNQSGIVNFHIDNSSYLSSINKIESTNSFTISYIKIISLDQYFEKFDLTDISDIYIKVDIEGHEKEMIEGSLNFIEKYRPTLLIEINDCKNNFMFISEKLSDYVCFAVLSEKWDNKFLKKINNCKDALNSNVSDFLFVNDKKISNKLSNYSK